MAFNIFGSFIFIYIFSIDVCIYVKRSLEVPAFLVPSLLAVSCTGTGPTSHWVEQVDNSSMPTTQD